MYAVGNGFLFQAQRDGQVVQAHVVSRLVGGFKKVGTRSAATVAHYRAYRRFLPKSQ